MPKDSVMPEFVFRDGRLEITEPHCATWIRGWPEPAAQRRLSHDAWRDFRPAFRLLAPAVPAAYDHAYKSEACDSYDGFPADHAARKQSAYHAFRQTIPANFALLLEPFTGQQWNLLQLLHEKPAFVDLLQANPVLAWCVANNDQFIKLTALAPFLQARWQLHKKQRELLAWLGFPCSEALVKVMKKIRPEAVSPSGLKLLYHAAREREASLAAFAQLELINYGVLYLVCNPRTTAHLSHAVLREVANQPDELSDSPVATMLTDTLMLWERLRPGKPAPVFHSMRTLLELHDGLLADFNRLPTPEARRRGAGRKNAISKPDGSFPPPPLPGSATIVPICNAEDMRLEGRNQRNCVGLYPEAVKTGCMYFYRVLRPQRATLELRRAVWGDWALHEIRAAGNKLVKPATLLHVQAWLAKTRAG